jgi:hypothetical protein
MTGASIEDGDWVVIRRQPTVENGEIAAAVIVNDVTGDPEVTLKTLSSSTSPATQTWSVGAARTHLAQLTGRDLGWLGSTGERQDGTPPRRRGPLFIVNFT